MKRILAQLDSGKTDRCPLGSGGVYADIEAGAQVYVEDRSRAAVAASTLTGGVLSRRGCTFDFTAPVPDLPFYRIHVTHREQMVFSHEDMVRQHWKVRLQTSY
jgi:hypothetical protein